MRSKPLVLLLCAVAILTGGCASMRSKSPAAKVPTAFLATCQRLEIAPTQYLLSVDIAAQTVSLFETNQFISRFPCSTSRFGIGETNGSLCTPRGLHRIAEKIGDGEPAGTIFKNREVVGQVSELGTPAGGITTRIMWLEGMEPGFNRGTNGTVNVDTHDREIYIHGTGDQHSLGKPASHGCIHLADANLISLFDLLPSGTLVWIAEH